MIARYTFLTSTLSQTYLLFDYRLIATLSTGGDKMSSPIQASDGSWTKWMMILGAVGTAVSAVATIFIACVYFSQAKIMRATLDSMKESTRISQMPILQTKLSNDPKFEAIYLPDTTEEGGERWILPYWVVNPSNYTVHDLSYYHAVGTSDTMALPPDDKFVHRYQKDVIFPNDTVHCGWDPILRQIVLDSVKAGKSFYRHFWVKYRDEFQNPYVYYTVWQISSPVKGASPQFAFVSRRRLAIQ
jgi:hypothetical protein